MSGKPKGEPRQTRVDTKGYIVVKAGPQRDRRVHILVAEGIVKRKLKKSETVHHKDGDLTNPHWTNLLVIDRSLHGVVSNRQYYYLKQKFSKEEAAWRAFFDVTGKTYDEYEAEQQDQTDFDPARF